MGLTVAEKIIAKHLVDGRLERGAPIAIRIDQTLTQDATGTMAYLQFEAMTVPQVKTDLSVSYVDHNTLQNDFMNMDDHRYLQSVAAKYGVKFSRPGNGICHQVHLERFGQPGTTLLGSDSHTPTGGGLGQLAIGAGGLDVACAMAGQPFYLTMPQIVKIHLTGHLPPFVSAKDIILAVLRQLTVKGGVGKIIEYSGDGVRTLSVPERATIANMGAELGATTSVFPSDAETQNFLQAQGRAADWQELCADRDAVYDQEFSLNLSDLEPLVACPHMPDLVQKAAELADLKVDQVLIGSCTNSSYKDLMTIAYMLKGKKIHPQISLGIAPGSKQVLAMIAANGALSHLVAAGARILESACGFCIGMGQAPNSGGVSVRTNNRNFQGRSGTKDAGIYLVSPETAAATALCGRLTDPRTLNLAPYEFELPRQFTIDDSLVLEPNPQTEIIRGPNIQPCPKREALTETLAGEVLLKIGDNITTDDIMPAGAKVLPLRSNVPAIANFVFASLDPTFAKRALEKKGGLIVGGENYGQGSSREHAALAPMYLGVQAVIAKSFARIHKANLVNFGILPLTFTDPADYDKITQGAVWKITNILARLKTNENLSAESNGQKITLAYDLSDRDREILRAGGMLNFVSKL
ncbi:aconitate hydratase [Candidatus Termititenax persephonae]|uniref:Aconitate hydratase n=1 Tax=Candidatus Termititenax persephonae TaxID=2218525 RepID=A0A388TGQ7_9BACT|nr:aconitate hydratase [Candidatus Termititenax persephonae]